MYLFEDLSNISAFTLLAAGCPGSCPSLRACNMSSAVCSCPHHTTHLSRSSVLPAELLWLLLVAVDSLYLHTHIPSHLWQPTVLCLVTHMEWTLSRVE